MDGEELNSGSFLYEEAQMQNDAKNTEPAHVKLLHTHYDAR